MNIERNQAIVGGLPFEVWENIFKRLPVKDQFQILQRVSKQFRSFVASMNPHLHMNPFMNLLDFCSRINWQLKKSTPSEQAVLHAVIPILANTGISLAPNKELLLHHRHRGYITEDGCITMRTFCSAKALLFNTATNQIGYQREMSSKYIHGFSLLQKAGKGFFINGGWEDDDDSDRTAYYARLCDFQTWPDIDSKLWLPLSKWDYFRLTGGGDINGGDFLPMSAGKGALSDVSGICSTKQKGPDTACNKEIPFDIAKEQSAVGSSSQQTETSDKADKKTVSEGIILTHTSTSLFACCLTAENRDGVKKKNKIFITAPVITHKAIDENEEELKVIGAAKLIRSGDDVLAAYLVIEQQEKREGDALIFWPIVTIHVAKLDFTTKTWQPQQSMSYVAPANDLPFMKPYHSTYVECDFGFLDGVFILGFRNVIVAFDFLSGEKITTFPIAADAKTIIRQIELGKDESDGDIRMAVAISSCGSDAVQQVYVLSTKGSPPTVLQQISNTAAAAAIKHGTEFVEFAEEAKSWPKRIWESELLADIQDYILIIICVLTLPLWIIPYVIYHCFNRSNEEN